MRIKIPSDSLEWVKGRVQGFSEKSLLELIQGGIKMLKVAPLASYPPHQHRDKTEFIYILEGNLKITIGNNNFDGKKGDFFMIPMSSKHSISNPFESESIILLGNMRE